LAFGDRLLRSSISSEAAGNWREISPMNAGVVWSVLPSPTLTHVKGAEKLPNTELDAWHPVPGLMEINTVIGAWHL